MDKEIDPEGDLLCAVCGENVEHDCDPVYATCFLPGTGKATFEFPLCGSHAVDVRARATVNGELLPDRDPVSRGLASGSTPAPGPWAQLGIVPRE